MEHTLLLVDGNSIVNRAFFGLGANTRLTAPDGRPTGAVLTFFNILLKHMKAEEPTHVLVTFDRPEPTFRHESFDGYKATRKGMPEDLAVQMPILKSCLAALGIEQVELPGFEADDLIGTFAKQGEAAGMKVLILTGDKDSFQLIRDDIHVLMPGARASLGDTVYDRAEFHKRYGIEPEAFIDVKAIMGDSSDNIPGVKGIGEKGALDLIGRFGDLDTVYLHLDELKPGQRKNLVEHKDMAYLSRELATIQTDVAVDLKLDETVLPTHYGSEALNLFRSLGFTSLIDRMELTAYTGGEEIASASDDGATLSYTSEFLASELEWPNEIDVNYGDYETILELLRAQEEGSRAHLLCRSKEDKDGNTACVLVYGQAHDKLILDSEFDKANLQSIIDSVIERKLELVGYDLKDWLRYARVNMQMSVFDTQSAAYLLSLQEQFGEEGALYAALSGGASDRLSLRPVSEEMEATELHADPGAEELAAMQVELEEEALRSVFWSGVIEAALRTELETMGMTKLARDCDMPLVLCLSKIEHRGFLVDTDVLDELSLDFKAQIDVLEEEIYRLAGKSFTINSPKQLGDILFIDLGLPSGKKGKSGNYSTAQAELDRLRPMHPIIDKITDYRQLTKLRSTFVEGLSKYVDPTDGRIHSHFNANFTNTGRLSSKDPNLQNIPVRQAVGREIRKAFVAEEGSILLDADYSQIELRLLAELSGDSAMIEAYQKGVDIHSLTASRIFHVPVEDVDSELRSRAKTINFSIVYGISDFGLSQRLELSIPEARQYIDNYYNGYPAVKPFMEQQIELAKERGYSETLFGRRRNIPELSSKNRNLRQFGERVAMNSPVQGTAADIIRIAMVNCAKRLEEEGIRGQLVSQVHDELIIEVSVEDQEKAAKILQETMEGAVSLSVPMEAEVSSGRTWYEAK